MANDNNWDDQTEALKALAENFGAMQQKALRKVANLIKPRLAEATPVRGIEAGGYGPLPEGALRGAVKGHVFKGDGEKPPAAIVDHGKFAYIARLVDEGHRAPHARALARAGRTPTGRPTPAHPFIRAVQDGTATAAQEAYEAAITEQITKAINGS